MFVLNIERIGVVVHRLGRGKGFITERLLAQAQRLAEHRLGAGRIIKVGVDLPQYLPQIRLHLRLATEARAQSLGGLIQNCPQKFGVHPLENIGPHIRKHVFHGLRDLCAAGGLSLGGGAFLLSNSSFPQCPGKGQTGARGDSPRRSVNKTAAAAKKPSLFRRMDF